ncbi:MAG: transporter substrate-binding domain-containing protein [Muribaculaceae bacterium]|nr:transporter substrate-binding domain-containing protein [Muribaculaceae bacterium]
MDTENTKKLRGLLPVIAAIVIVVLGAGGMIRRCSDAPVVGSPGYVKAGGDTLTVAIEMSPLSYTLRNDTAEGFDYSILRAIGAEHHLTFDFYPTSDLDAAFLGLKNGDYDMVVASIPATNALKEYFLLTDAVYLDKQVLVQRRDSTGGAGAVSSQVQLLYDTVWVADGSPYRTRLRNMSRELGDTIYVESPAHHSSEHLAILTALGEVKQAVVNEAVARRIAAEYPNLDVSTPISFNQLQCWAVAPSDSVLLDSLNLWLGEFKHTPQYKALMEKYEL